MSLPRSPGRLTPAFGFSFVLRALQEGLARRQFGQSEMTQIVEFFGAPVECVFCGSSDVKRWDHLIAVTHGGETVIGNMVPACASCDDSKQHKPYQEWMTKRGLALNHSESEIDTRIAKLEDYAKTFKYVHSSMHERLTNEERASLEEIQVEMSDLKLRIESLIAQYRVRTGSK